MVGRAFSTVLGLISPFIYAFGIAYILNPILKFIERAILSPLLGKHVSGKCIRAVAVLLTFLFAAGVIAVFVMIVIPQLISSITGLVYRLSPLTSIRLTPGCRACWRSSPTSTLTPRSRTRSGSTPTRS